MVQISQHADLAVNKILIGNKADMLDAKQVSTDEAQALADKYGIPFFECSAKAGIKVPESFETIARQVATRISAEDGSKPTGGATIKPSENPGGGGGGCCK